jgi:putative transposase
MNGHTERFVGFVRRELLDHVIVLNENQLRRLTTAYVSYHHHDRTHLALDKTIPSEPRP